MKRILIVAYYFPPLGMGGVQRVAKWAKYLPQFGWEPHVLTVKPIRYHAFDEALFEEVQHLPIYRTESLDPARLAQRFFSQKSGNLSPSNGLSSTFLSMSRRFFLPDSKMGWYPSALKSASRIIEKIHPKAILTTSPPLTAHLIGLRLKKQYDLPWVADFRDYWLGGEYVHTPTPVHTYFHQRWAQKVVQRAEAILAISDPILASLRALESGVPHKFHLLPNGFDPEDFEGVAPRKFQKKTLLYLGSLGGANDPQIFFEGMKRLVKHDNRVLNDWQIAFWGQPLEKVAVPPEIHPWVRFWPYSSHRESLAALLGARGLLFFLASNVNRGMMTGKIFEYIASGRPIFAILPAQTAATTILQRYGFGKIVTKMEPSIVARELHDFLVNPPEPQDLQKGEAFRMLFSRRDLTRQLADVLKTLIIPKEK